jgi:hypothetical protein
MTPSSGPPKKGLLILADDKGGPPPLTSPEGDEQEPAGAPECENCKFYSDSQCKRYPQWVDRMPEDWCGEFRPGKAPASDNAQPSQSQQTPTSNPYQAQAGGQR